LAWRERVLSWDYAIRLEPAGRRELHGEELASFLREVKSWHLGYIDRALADL
jgi:hypothetical protein